MGWLSGKAVYEEREIKCEKDDKKKYVQIRITVDKNTWKIFKGTVQMIDIDMRDAMTEAMKLYLSKIVDYKRK